MRSGHPCDRVAFVCSEFKALAYRLKLIYNIIMRTTESELRRLYVEERKTTYEIGDIYGVSRVSVTRWLRKCGIQLRPGSNGLKNRGIEEPTKGHLFELVHIQHLSYEQIASMYGVDFSAVPHWLKRHDIKLPLVWTTRRKGKQTSIDPDEVRGMVESGIPLADIASHYSVSKWMISSVCDSNGIAKRPDGFNGGVRYDGPNGLKVRSTYELRVAEWLSLNAVSFIYEPRLPFNRRLRADFIANGWYIEVWGVQGSKAYTEKRERKRKAYKANQLPLIQITPRHIASGSFSRRLEKCLVSPSVQGLLEFHGGGQDSNDGLALL